jgi:DNA-binding SARP family transcriptional activator
MEARPRTRSAIPPRTGSPALTVWTLGPLRLARDGEAIPPTAWHRLKARTLFAYLLCARPRRVHKEVLIDLLWPDAEPNRGAHALQVTLSDLRRTLGGGDHLRRVGPLYGLELGEAGVVDVELFEEECERARLRAEAGETDATLTHLLAAQGLYRGEFLAEEPFADWAVARRERLRDDYVDVLLRLERHYEAAGGMELAARYAKQVLAVDPYLEPCYRDLMRHLKALGDHGGVLRTYVRCQEAMREGFDGEVAAETRALAQSLIGARVDMVAQRHRRTHRWPGACVPRNRRAADAAGGR